MRGAVISRPRSASLMGAVALTLLLTGCGFNVREDLGLISKGPDEFTVVKKKPLQMPDNRTALPAPRPGAESLVEPKPLDDARTALTGGRSKIVASAPSKAENALLTAANAEAADPSIRKKLGSEDRSGEARLLDGLLGKSDPNEDPLDAKAEADRLADKARESKNPSLERNSEQ